MISIILSCLIIISCLILYFVLPKLFKINDERKKLNTEYMINVQTKQIFEDAYRIGRKQNKEILETSKHLN